MLFSSFRKLIGFSWERSLPQKRYRSFSPLQYPVYALKINEIGLLLRSHQHHHVAPFFLGRLLHFGEVLQVSCHAFEQHFC